MMQLCEGLLTVENEAQVSLRPSVGRRRRRQGQRAELYVT